MDSNQMLVELESLREEVEALRAGARSAGMRGHLSKFNEEGALAGMFSLDWELRYFILSGPILRYYTSERDIALDPRGVLDIEGCAVTVSPQLSIGGARDGPVGFIIQDPSGLTLLRLRSDSRLDVINWLSAFRDQGCRVTGLEQLLLQQHPGAVEPPTPFAAPGAVAVAGGISGDGGGGQGLSKLQSLRWEKASEGDELPDHDLSGFEEEVPALASVKSAPPVFRSESGSLQQQQQQPTVSSNSGAAAGGGGYRGSRLSQSSSQREQAAGGGQPAPASAAAAEAPAAAAAHTPSEEGQQPPGSSSGSGTARGGLPRSFTRTRTVVKRSGGRRAMLSYTPVHLAVKDSPLTFKETWSMRHEGLLNLALVVLVCTNLRAFLENLLTHGLRLSLFRVDYTRLAQETTWADALVVGLAAGLWGYAGLALGVERLGWALLQRELKAAQGSWKRTEEPAAAAAAAAAGGGEGGGSPPVSDAIKQQRRAAAGRAAATENIMFVLNALNTSACLCVPLGVVYLGTAAALPGAVLTQAAIVLWLKLVSYAHCNAGLRDLYRQQALQQLYGDGGAEQGEGNSSGSTPGSVDGSGVAAVAAGAAAAPAGPTADGQQQQQQKSGAKPAADSLLSQHTWDRPTWKLADLVSGVTYPQNLTWVNVLWYSVVPTLTYQCSYPLRESIRWKRLAQWVALLLLTASLHTFMLDQLLLPNMTSALGPLRALNYAAFAERLLKLALPNLYCWLVMFGLVFHLWLNVLGELTYFGDRVFYKEWWNAATLADYWKLWNIPVHAWMLRTLYFPMVRRKWGRFTAGVIVFLVSAVLHEAAVGVPLRMVKGWAFWAMLMQVPLVAWTEVLRKRLKSDTLGNIIFWTSFCVLGQPICLLMYYHDWLLDHTGSPQHIDALACATPSPGMEAVCSNLTLPLVVAE